MPLSTAANVRQTGGIAESNAYLLFQVADDTALNTEVTRMLARASAWLANHVEDATVYTGSATADTNIDAMFEGAEEALTMHFLTMQLKARKVYGTHFPYDQEGSERFEELIDVEWFRQMESFVSTYLNTQDDPTHTFALPVLGSTGTIIATDLEPITTTLGKVLDRAENNVQRPLGPWVWP